MRYFYLCIVTGFLLLTYTSCDEITGVEDISKSYVAVIAPVHNSEVIVGNVTFAWITCKYLFYYGLNRRRVRVESEGNKLRV